MKTNIHTLSRALLMAALFASESAFAASFPQRGPSSSKDPYIEPMDSGTTFTSILTTGDSVNTKPDGVTPYRMAGIPDGLGSFDNGDGTFTLLSNHEIGLNGGVARAHGGNGTFVSKWIINKSTLQVTRGGDLFTNVFLYNTNTLSYYLGTNVGMARFCSADLPPVTAFYNAATGLGTTNRIFMNGEENNPGSRALAHLVTGPDAGKSWELAWLGKMNWENSIASPTPQNKTTVACMDDSGTTDSQLYLYVGTKQSTGLDIERAGLVNGQLYGVSVSGITLETAGTGAQQRNFGLVNLSAVTSIPVTTAARLDQLSNSNAVTAFMRTEDGAWDPKDPRNFYFVTTASATLPSRLWRLRFNDIANPEQGGVRWSISIRRRLRARRRSFIGLFQCLSRSTSVFV